MSRYIRQPSPRTLAKYGLTIQDWESILRRQHFRCALGHEFPDGHSQIDHEHVRMYANLSDDERKSKVRGLLCGFCNHYVVGRHKDGDRLIAAGKYLNAYAKRSNRLRTQ